MRRVVEFAGVIVFVLSLVGCTRSDAALAPRPTPATKSEVYVAIGSDDSIGAGTTDPLLDAWPQLFFRRALTRSAVFYNLAEAGSTTEQALADQVPAVSGLNPTVVTVWLNETDVFAGVSPDSYGSSLKSLVTALRQGGAATVLVANTPPLSHLPGYLACLSGNQMDQAFSCPDPIPSGPDLDATVAAYNQITASVVAATGAVLVDLHAALLAAEASGSVASDRTRRYQPIRLRRWPRRSHLCGPALRHRPGTLTATSW